MVTKKEVNLNLMSNQIVYHTDIYTNYDHETLYLKKYLAKKWQRLLITSEFTFGNSKKKHHEVFLKNNSYIAFMIPCI